MASAKLDGSARSIEARSPVRANWLALMPTTQEVPAELNYAVVAQGRVVGVATRVVFGTVAAVARALTMSKVSRAINTSFLKRENGTARHRNARKARKTYRFSQDHRCHAAVTYFTMSSYNFCWAVRTLRVKDHQGGWVARTPAMAAG